MQKQFTSADDALNSALRQIESLKICTDPVPPKPNNALIKSPVGKVFRVLDDESNTNFGSLLYALPVGIVDVSDDTVAAVVLKCIREGGAVVMRVTYISGDDKWRTAEYPQSVLCGTNLRWASAAVPTRELCGSGFHSCLPPGPASPRI